MKKIIYIAVISALIIIGSCSDDSKLPVNFDDLEVSGAPFATDTDNSVDTNLNKLDPASSSFTKTYELHSPEAGEDITKVDVFVSLFRSIDLLEEEVFLKSFDSSLFTNGEGFKMLDLDLSGSEVITALGIDPAILEGGDVFSYRLALTNDEGTFSDVSANFDNQSADHSFSSTVVCELEIVPAGDWLIDMQDSYGDGWQPTTNNGGGPGIVVTLSDGTVFEIGLCTPYEDPGYDCTDGTSSGSRTISIPAGITSASWEFRGDNWGEMSFQIYAPSGNLVASALAGTAAGPIALNLCDE